AQGWISPGFRSAAMLRSYLREILCQIPDRSGLPSVVRGAGAVRSGLPSAVRGVPGAGWSIHCAASGVANADKIVANTMVFMPTSCEQRLLVVSCWPEGAEQCLLHEFAPKVLKIKIVFTSVFD